MRRFKTVSVISAFIAVLVALPTFAWAATSPSAVPGPRVSFKTWEADYVDAIPTYEGSDQITAGPDGALWFTESTNKIGRIDTSGKVSEYGNISDDGAGDITQGSDGALWFLESNSNMVGRITTAGTITEYAVSTAKCGLSDITQGPDGALWFTEDEVNKIGKITTAGQVTEFDCPTRVGEQITTGPDGALWFAGDGITRMTTTGSFTSYDVINDDSAGYNLPSVTNGPDGALWFTTYIGIRTVDTEDEITVGRMQLESSSAYYFAEGTCRPDFDTYFCIQNPNDSPADVALTYMKGDGKIDTDSVTVPAKSRATVSPRDRLGTGDDASHDFSSKVECTNGLPIVVERPMYFNYKGKWTGGTDVMGASAPSNTFYFAEGTCRPDFDTYFCIQNPGNDDADVEVKYVVTEEPLVSKTVKVKVPAHSRATVYSRDKLGTGDDAAHDFSTTISSNRPIVAERPMYFNYNGQWTGGSDVMGSTLYSDHWCFAEGCTRSTHDGDFHEWLCIESTYGEANVSITYMLEDGSTVEKEHFVPSMGRITVDVNADVGAGHDVSAKIWATADTADPHLWNYRAIVVERSMYFDYHGLTGGSSALGTSPSNASFFAEGTCRPNFDTYFSVQNPGDTSGAVTFNYMEGDGKTVKQSLSMSPHSRATVHPSDVIGAGEGPAYDFSATVESPGGTPVVVERPMYFNYKGVWTGGHDAAGYVPGIVP